MIPLNGNKINFKNLINKNFKNSKFIAYLARSNYCFLNIIAVFTIKL